MNILPKLAHAPWCRMSVQPERRIFSDSDGMLGSRFGEHGHELRIFVTFTNISWRQVGVNVTKIHKIFPCSPKNYPSIPKNQTFNL